MECLVSLEQRVQGAILHHHLLWRDSRDTLEILDIEEVMADLEIRVCQEILVSLVNLACLVYPEGRDSLESQVCLDLMVLLDYLEPRVILEFLEKLAYLDWMETVVEMVSLDCQDLRDRGVNQQLPFPLEGQDPLENLDPLDLKEKLVCLDWKD